MDDTIEEQIGRISINDWKPLFDLIPEIEECQDFGKMAGGEKLGDNFYHQLYIKPSEVVTKFISIVYDKNIIIKFAWPKWKEGSNAVENPNTDYSKLDYIFLTKLLTGITRNDRFGEGYLVSHFEKGTILKILKELKVKVMGKQKIYLQDILPLDKFKIDGKVLLIRHQHPQLYEMIEQGLIEEYQSYQNKAAFRDCKIIISFLAEPNNQAKLFGIYTKKEIKENDKVPSYSRSVAKCCNPIRRDIDFYMVLEPIVEFEKYNNRIVIDWGVRLWYNIYESYKKGKEVKKILPMNYVTDFPGFMKIKLTHYELKQIIENPDSNNIWYESLSRLQAVYLILDRDTGKQYIGTTYGEEGLWQRWSSYVKGDFTGGNAKLIELKNRDTDFYNKFQFTILAVLSKNATKLECLEAESLWQKKLGSKVDGLN